MLPSRSSGPFLSKERAGPVRRDPTQDAEKAAGGYIFGGNFSGSITNQTLPTFWPVTSPRFLSFCQ